MKITPGLIQLSSLLIAPIAALAGVWLSPHLTARLDHRRWLRERRSAAYLFAIEAMEGVLTAQIQDSAKAAILKLVKEKFPEYKDARGPDIPPEELWGMVGELTEQRLKTFYIPIIKADSQVALYGTEAARRITRQLVEALTDSSFEQLIKTIGSALNEFIAVCRSDLKVRSRPF